MRSSGRRREPGAEKTKGKHGNCLQISKGLLYVWKRGRLTLSEIRGREGSRLQVIKSKNKSTGCHGRRRVPHAGEIQAEAMGPLVMDIPQGPLLIRPLWSFLQSWSLVQPPISSSSPLCGLDRARPRHSRLDILSCPPLVRKGYPCLACDFSSLKVTRTQTSADL